MGDKKLHQRYVMLTVVWCVAFFIGMYWYLSTGFYAVTIPRGSFEKHPMLA